MQCSLQGLMKRKRRSPCRLKEAQKLLQPARSPMTDDKPADRPHPVLPSGMYAAVDVLAGRLPRAGFMPRPLAGPAQGGNDSTFRSLEKWIKNEAEVALFKRGETFADLMGFILACNQAGDSPHPPTCHSASPCAPAAVKGVSSAPPPPCSAFVSSFVGIIEGKCPAVPSTTSHRSRLNPLQRCSKALRTSPPRSSQCATATSPLGVASSFRPRHPFRLRPACVIPFQVVVRPRERLCGGAAPRRVARRRVLRRQREGAGRLPVQQLRRQTAH
jgi:hypothetical protein